MGTVFLMIYKDRNNYELNINDEIVIDIPYVHIYGILCV